VKMPADLLQAVAAHEQVGVAVAVARRRR